jgi:hypothetical protein
LSSISEPITPFGVLRVNTVQCSSYARLVGVDLKPVRMERLRLYAQRHGLEDNPSALGKAIGKRPNQVYNLLHGTASFGEKVARSIEEAAGLPKGWLDGEGADALSPEVAGLAMAIDNLPEGRPREWVLMTIREAVKIAREMPYEAAAQDAGDAPKRRKA